MSGTENHLNNGPRSLNHRLPRFAIWLLVLGLGYALGRGESLLESGATDGRTISRKSFSETEWVIRDFQSRFAEAYCRTITVPLMAERQSGNDPGGSTTIGGPSGIERSGDRLQSARSHGNQRSQQRQRWAELLQFQVQVLREVYPLEAVEADLLTFYQQEGMDREFIAFYKDLQRTAPRHFALPRFESHFRKLNGG